MAHATVRSSRWRCLATDPGKDREVDLTTTAVVDGDDPHDGHQGPHRHHPAVTHRRLRR